MAAEGMESELSKVLRWHPEQQELRVCAGIGWAEGVIGTATLPADTGSPAGYALQTGEPVVSNQLDKESRFRTPQLLLDHNVKSAVNVIIRAGDDRPPFGVLEVDSRTPGEFEEADVAFLQSFANLLGVAIERHFEQEGAHARQESLRREASHRIKNSLAMIGAFMALQARASTNKEVKAALYDAQSRVSAIAAVHDQLWRASSAEGLDLAEFLKSLCGKLAKIDPTHPIIVEAEPVDVTPERAIPAGLIVNELVTNAFKYAYPETTGPVRVSLSADDGTLCLTVADDGVGLPKDFHPDGLDTSLGMKVVNGLARELGGRLEVVAGGTGARFAVHFPASAGGGRTGVC